MDSERTAIRRNARAMGVVTILSRILGLWREMLAASAFGSNAIYAAFNLAFTVPNLFRKLLGEGAISSAFIPLYARAVENDHADPHADKSRRFASASVNFLLLLLMALTAIGEVILGAVYLLSEQPDRRLAMLLAMVMLPYALLVCATAFLAAILQVHRRFMAFAFTSVVLNVVLIVTMLLAYNRLDLRTHDGQIRGVWWLSFAVLVAGILQVAVLLPSLRAVGFRFRPSLQALTPEVRQMLRLTGPVALSAGVLQIGVVLDKSIAFYLSATPQYPTFTLFGHAIAYPMVDGATNRLNWAQYLYQLPLGIFAISVATAIFPRLSSAAADRARFAQTIRHGIEACMLTALPATAGLMIAAGPIVRLLFQAGNFTEADSLLTARSTAVYAAAVWAFALLQVISRGFYALHDTVTPFRWSIYNLIINLVVEIPLVFAGMGECGMAVGTAVSFMIQAVWMTRQLSSACRAIPTQPDSPETTGMGLQLRLSRRPLLKMMLATFVMSAACFAAMASPWYPTGTGKRVWAIQTFGLMAVGAVTYFSTCHLLGIRLRQRKAPAAV